MTNHIVCNRADLREITKTMSRHGDRRGQIADFRDSFETINWLYLFFSCGIKTKTHFEWLFWHWSSLGQLNLEPTRPNGLVGCKVPTDLVKISVKEATHMGFHYTNWRRILKTYRCHICRDFKKQLLTCWRKPYYTQYETALHDCLWIFKPACPFVRGILSTSIVKQLSYLQWRVHYIPHWPHHR